MKKSLIPGLILAVSAVASAETYNYLTIRQNDKTVSIPIECVESVTFTVEDLSTPVDDPTLDYELRVLTFEDADYFGGPNYLGQSNWSSLIDSPQYGGSLLYADYNGTDYRWYDENNTGLYAAIDPDSEGNVYWSGGEALSNYVNAAYATTEVDYTQQLSTPTGGHDGSSNFCVHAGYFDGVFYDSPRGGIWFKDGVARVVDHMYVSLTSYGLSVGIRGNDFTAAATASDWVKFVAIGTDAQGNRHQAEITMCENGQFKTTWQRFDLSELGEIVRLDFNITSSMTGEYGLNFPGYIAYDDVAVRFPKN